MKLLRLCIKLMIICYSILATGVVLIPPISYYLDPTKLEPIIPVCLPWTSLDTTSEYILNLIYQGLCIIYGLIAYVFFDIIFLFKILHVSLLTNILRKKIGSITEMLTEKAPDIELKINIRNIIQLHKEVLRFGHCMAGFKRVFIILIRLNIVLWTIYGTLITFLLHWSFYWQLEALERKYLHQYR